jgi:hypothetical protein
MLSEMGSLCVEFEAAVILFVSSTSGANPADQGVGRLKFQWIHMAARDAASVIYRFNEAIKTLDDNLGNCPTLLEKINTTEKRRTANLFKSYFPRFEKIRDSSQHPSKIYGSPEDVARHAKYGWIGINNILGNTITTTYGKQELRLELTRTSLAKLFRIKDLYWNLFAHLDPMRLRMMALEPHLEQLKRALPPDTDRNRPQGK